MIESSAVVRRRKEKRSNQRVKTFQTNLKSYTSAESSDDSDHDELGIKMPLKEKRQRKGKMILLDRVLEIGNVIFFVSNILMNYQ